MSVAAIAAADCNFCYFYFGFLVATASTTAAAEVNIEAVQLARMLVTPL